MKENENDMIKVILAFGDLAYDVKLEHEGEVHTAREWLDIYSEYCPAEILEFEDEDAMYEGTMNPGTSMIPRYYQKEGISDNMAR